MSKQRRTFSSEFKQQVAFLVLDRDYASHLLSVSETALRRWVQHFR